MNRYKPHVYVIPEDRRNEEIANGFVLHHQVKNPRIQIVPVAGGWAKVLETFCNEYISTLRNYQNAHVVMLIDFDDQIKDRKALFAEKIPQDCKTRVFVIGSKHEPEMLKRALNIGFEEIGKSLADDCGANTAEHWNHEQLQHNDAERQRLVETVKPFIFQRHG